MDAQPNQHASPEAIARHGRQKTTGAARFLLTLVGVGVTVVVVSAASIVAIDTATTLNAVPSFDLPNASGGAPPDIGAMEGGFNILIVGSDRGETEQEIKDRGGAELNDVTMLLHVSGDHTRAVAVSIPRDLVVPIPSCPKEDGSGNHPSMAAQPINVTLSYGGVPCTILTVEALTGLHVDFAGLITFQGVIQMSNALGGVPVCIAEDINDPASGFSRPAGTYVLSGSEALAFLRARKHVGDGSDLARISSQQVFLSSMVRTLKSEDTLNDPVKLYSIAQAAITNMSLSSNFRNTDTLFSIARALSTLELDQVTFVQYPGTTNSPGIYQNKVKPNAAVASQLFAKILADEPFALDASEDALGSVPDPNATPSLDASADPSAAPVDVIAGLPGQTAAEQTCSKGRK